MVRGEYVIDLVMRTAASAGVETAVAGYLHPDLVAVCAMQA